MRITDLQAMMSQQAPRVLSVVFAVGLAAAGMVAVVAAPAAAAVPALTMVSIQVSGDQATVVYRTNRKTTRPKTRVCTLNGAATGCGKLTGSTRRANTYTVKWSGLDDGAYRFRVSIKRTAAAGGGTVSRTARFTISTCTVTNTTTDTTTRGKGANLQTAINQATAGDTLKVAGTCVGNYYITKNLTVAGPATGTATLDGNQADSAVKINSFGRATLDNLTITGGNTVNSGGGIFNGGGSVTVTDSTITGNTATNTVGGGIFNTGGSVTVTDSTITGNTADFGGGIYAYSGAVTVQGSSQITGNTAGVDGGGIYNDVGTVTVYYCAGVTISGNTPNDTKGSITTGTCV